MKQVKKGWVIKNIHADDFLQSEFDDDFGSLASAHIFRLKREAVDNMDEAYGVKGEEIVLKAQITVELL